MKRLAILGAAATFPGCVSIEDPLPPPYHGLGTEPFWSLSIDEHDISFAEAGRQPISEPSPKVVIGIAGEIYGTSRIEVNIIHSKCSDGMSDRALPGQVQVTVDGKRFNGCGGL